MTKRMVIAALSLVGCFVALYLTLYKFGVFGVLKCGVGSCETVNTSRWAEFLGLPVAAWGLAFYLAALAVSLVGVQDRWVDSLAVSRVLVGMSAVGVLFSGWLTYLEAFVIHAYCLYCLVSAAIVTVIFAVAVADLREFGGDAGGAEPERGRHAAGDVAPAPH
jgi:uncharacterized membrane protein